MALTEAVLANFLVALDCQQKKLCLGGNILFPRFGCKVTDKDIIEICKFMGENKVVSLDLCYNNITDDGLFILIFYLKSSHYELAYLNLMCNNITSKGIKFIYESGSDLKVKALRLNGNKIAPEGGKFLAEFLETNNYMEQLDIGETDQNTESLVYIAAILKSPNIALRSIDLSKPLLIFSQSHVAEILGKMLYENVHLRELVLRKCGLGDHDMEFLSMGLHKLANEKFTIPKLELFAQEETSSSYTEVIVLTGEEEADFESEGNNLSKDERNDTKFECLLEENSTGLNICNPLKRFIAKDGLVSHLLHLDLSCNNISDDTIDYLRPYLLSGPPLLSLNFSHNVLHDVGVVELSKCIPSTKLEFLDISHNQVGHDGIRSITYHLKRSSPLQKIHIWGNQLNEEICQVLHELIGDGNILQENIDVALYEVDEKYFAAYNNKIENHHVKYYCIPQCPLFSKNL